MPMKRLSLFALAAVVACGVMYAQPRKTIYDQLLRPPKTALYHVPVGTCEDYPEETTTPELIHNDMEMLKRAHINLLRISFGWDGIEEVAGKYDWLFWDDYVRTAVDDYGITLVPYICYTPRWNSTGDSTNYWNHTPKDYEAFGRFVYALVSRYKDRIKSWELWNEPDIREYWSGTAGDLARLTKIGAEAVKRADPNAIVVLAGLAGHVDFTKALFRDYGISKYVDVVNCHSYYETWNGDPLETVVPYVNTLYDIVQRYGNHQSLWMAEVGYSTFRKPDGYVSDSYTCTYDYEHTPAFQAIALWRTLTLLLSTNKMAAITWYELKDLPPGENVIGDVNNRNLGVDYVGWKPKPAEGALKFFNAFFSSKSICIDDQVRVTRLLGSESEVHVFRMEDGSVAVVGWLKTEVRGKTFEQTPGSLKDTRVENIDLTIPGAKGTTATRYDVEGTSSPYTGISKAGDAVRLPALRLAGGSIVIVKIHER